MSRLYTNNFSTTLNGAIGSGDTTITVTSATGLPAVGAGQTCHLTIDDGTNIEIVRATAVSGNDITVVRAIEGTGATAFADLTPIELRATAESFERDAIDTDIVPDADSVRDLGTSGERWANLYVDDIIVTTNVDGRDISTDGTKLDGIEAGADVTDETNVTAALSGATITSATVATGDKVLIQDLDDSDNLKTVTAQSIADLGVQSLDDLTDVSVTTPSAGQVLIYNTTTFDNAALTEGEGIDITNGAGSITIAAEDASDVNKGVASFNATDFSVTAGNVTLQTERLQDVTGAMFTGNTETGITVTYEDADGTIDLVVSDTTVAGDTGSTGITPGDTLTIAGGTNATTSMSGDTLTINVDDAFLSNTGDVGTGSYDFGGADDFEIPNSATPIVDTDGQVAIDTTVTDFSAGVLKYYSGEEMGTVAMPIAEFTTPNDGDVVTYNATNDEFELATPAAQVATVAQKNVIIGGDFSINPWQRGTSFTAPTTGDYTADRFSIDYVTSGVVDVLKTTDAPTVAQASILTSHCLHVDVTTADATIAATDYMAVSYKVEGYDWSRLAQRACTLTFWHKHTKTGTHCVGIRNSGTDRYFIAEYTQSTTDTWEQATISIDASPSAGTWDYTNGTGLEILFVLAAGSNFQGTAGSWGTGSLFATSNQVNNLDSTSNNFKLDLIQLEEGSTATAFEVRHYTQEHILCERYYLRLNEATEVRDFTVGQAISTSTALTIHGFPIEMRAAPTATASGTSALKIFDATGTGASSTSVTFSGARTAGIQIAGARTGSGLVAGNASLIQINTSEYLEFDAEL